MTRSHPRARLVVVLAALATVGISACGADNSGSATPGTSPASPTVPLTAPPSNGGGGMQAGAPQFASFNVSSSVPCQNGNANATMSFSTRNVVEIEIKIGDGRFATTAGYGPNESGVVASIPCSGPGRSSIQLRGCTENDDCVDSSQHLVQITA